MSNTRLTNVKNVYKRMAVHKIIENQLNFLDYRLDEDNLDTKKWHYYMGQKEALMFLGKKHHKEILAEIKNCMSEINELDINDELYQMEYSFLEGYIKGTEIILNANRKAISEPDNLRLLGLCPDEEIAALLTVIFEEWGFVSSVKRIDGLSFYFTSNADSINLQRDENGINEQIVIFSVLFSDKKKRIDNRLFSEDSDIRDLKKEVLNEKARKSLIENYYIHEIQKLDLNRAKLVMIDSVFTIDSLVNKTLLALSI